MNNEPKTPVKLVLHCTYYFYLMTLSGSVGYNRAVEDLLFAVTLAYDYILIDEFCKEHGISDVSVHAPNLSLGGRE